ncbi:glutathione peroxidase [Iodobacter ciconiae]|uniref:Glutathione peroxidase n=1 Tax=Iodobacter ciconiae TaxID=2496266 RepID=A0A3S8ZTC0_9NEIS|nr:glutathione peroxidase [Iodobacter ciconiae]AZN36722.1 glutathione peroxidase [Iodobacter ciconiae]
MRILALLAFCSSMSLAACPPLLDYQSKTLKGEAFDLCSYSGKPILVVNTASKCGFTPQFEKLEKIYAKYKEQGLLVVGFPSNDFKQELTDNKEIGDFCRLTYFVKFPMLEKSSVRGSNANPLFQRLSRASDTTPKWNFYKYLIAPDGKTVSAYSSLTEPDDKEIIAKIESWLKK